MSDYPIIDDDRAPPPAPAAGPAGLTQKLAWVVAAASLLGAVFSALSTSDFINHLDRQVHSIHCSFIPGAHAELGESGCRTVMMSPYSSLFRESLWGGMPISLLALAVFSYLTFRAVSFALRGPLTKGESTFLLAAAALPLVMSVIYGFIAATRIHAVCKLCVGVYVTSTIAFVAALIAHLKTAPEETWDPERKQPGTWFGEGVVFVAVLALLYAVASPTSEKTLKGCGTLVRKDDVGGVFIPFGGKGNTQSIAVLDPLCPACRAFDQRLEASGLINRLKLDMVLFPLDSTCNWMVKESLHPGACAVSEAMLCDKDAAPQVLEYAFANQEALRDEASRDEAALRRRLEQKFPKVKGCLGSAAIKNKLNKSLRWAVANALPVLTPQLFVGDKRVCDEDTDLGLEFTLASMLREPSGKGRGKR